MYDSGTQGLNRYSYALNNPFRYTDPTGHWTNPFITMFRGFAGWGDAGVSIGRTMQAEAQGAAQGAIEGAATGGLMISSMTVPYAGEALDIAVLTNPNATGWQKVGAGVSLGISVLTVGLSPNYGAMDEGISVGNYGAVDDSLKSITGARTSARPKSLETLDDIIRMNKGVNPGFRELSGRQNNCPYCVMAFDSSIAHRIPLQAPPRNYMGEIGSSYIEGFYGKNFQWNLYPESITAEMRNAGHGARGIVAIRRSGKEHHLINVLNWDKKVYYFDPQIGKYKEGGFPQYDWSSLGLLRTN